MGRAHRFQLLAAAAAFLLLHTPMPVSCADLDALVHKGCANQSFPGGALPLTVTALSSALLLKNRGDSICIFFFGSRLQRRPGELLGKWPGRRGRARHWAPVRAPVRRGSGRRPLPAQAPAYRGSSLRRGPRATRLWCRADERGPPVPRGSSCGAAPCGRGWSPEQEKGGRRGSPEPGEERRGWILGGVGSSDEDRIYSRGFLLKMSLIIDTVFYT
jgi:hypothetical protein